MSRNRDPVKPVEFESESGEEDDDATSSDGSNSDSEPEPEQTQEPKKSAAKQSVPPPPLPHSSDEESGSETDEESGSEADEESDGPDSSVRPLALKPIESLTQKSSNGAKNSNSKPVAPEPVTPTKSTVAKRSAEDTGTDTKDSKKLKKTPESETSEKKVNLFQRLWSEDDEIVILQGMIDYTSKNKSDPNSDLNAFHDFIKRNLHLDFTRAQLQDKIRRLKKKYENNKNKVKEGKEKTFSKPHEQKAYDLSKTIWGNVAGKEKMGEKVVESSKANGSVARKTVSKKFNAESEGVKDAENFMVVSGQGEKLPVKNPLTNSSGGWTTMEERMLISGRELFEVRRGLEGEQEWEELRREELKLYLKQLELRAAQTKLVLDVMKAGDH